MSTELTELESLARRVRCLCGTPMVAERHHLGALYWLLESDTTCFNSVRLRTVVWQLCLRAYWAKINQAFQEVGIPVALLKGIRWSDSLFPDAWLRPTGDLDILVRSEDITRASRLLEEIGATPDNPGITAERAAKEHFHLQFRFEDAKPSVLVELHWQITVPWDIQLPEHVLWENVEETQDGYVLNRELDLLHACIHAYRHVFTPYRTLIDIERMLFVFGDQIHWDRFWNLAGQAQATRVITFVLLLSSQHLAFELPIGSQSLTSFQRRWFSLVAAPLSPRILLKYSRYMAPLKAYVALVTGTLPKMGQVFRQVFMPHPDLLASVYGIDPTNSLQVLLAYLLRPFRLLLKYLDPVQRR